MATREELEKRLENRKSRNRSKTYTKAELQARLDARLTTKKETAKTASQIQEEQRSAVNNSDFAKTMQARNLIAQRTGFSPALPYGAQMQMKNAALKKHYEEVVKPQQVQAQANFDRLARSEKQIAEREIKNEISAMQNAHPEWHKDTLYLAAFGGEDFADAGIFDIETWDVYKNLPDTYDGIKNSVITKEKVAEWRAQGYSDKDIADHLRLYAENAADFQNTVSDALINKHLTQKEKYAFLRLWEEKGRDTAEKYLNSLRDTAAAREGAQIYSDLDSGFDKRLYQYKYGLKKGLQGFEAMGYASDLKSSVTADDAASGLIYEDSLNEDGSKSFTTYLDMGLQSAGSMTPSMVVGAIPGVGTVARALTTIGTAGGSAMIEARRQGKDYDKALQYGLLSGTAEAGLDYLLGGIGKGVSGVVSKLGGEALENTAKAFANASPKVAQLFKWAGVFGGKMGGEFLEEYSQEILDPVFRNIVFDENNEVKLFSSEALEAGILGAVMAVVFDGFGVGSAIDVRNDSAVDAQITRELLKKGLSDAEIDEAIAEFRNIIPYNTMSDSAVKEMFVDPAEQTRNTFSSAGQAAFDIAMENSTDKGAAARQFEIKYREGELGYAFEVDEDSELTPSMQEAAHKYGAEAKAALGTVTYNTRTKVSDSLSKSFEKTAKDLNVHITYGGKAPVVNGVQDRAYITSAGELRIYEDVEVRLADGRVLKGDDAATMVILGHEMTHRLQALDEKSYNAFREFVLARKNGAIEGYMKMGLSRDVATDEIVADYAMTTLFADQKIINEVTKKHSKLAETVRDILEWIKTKLGIQSSELDRAIRLWNNAYNASVRNAKSGTQTKNTADGGVMYSKGNIENIIEADVKKLQSIGRKMISQFNSTEIKIAEKWAQKFYREIGVKSPFFRSWFGDWRQYDNSPIEIATIPEYIPTNEARKAYRGTVVCKDTKMGENVGWNITISREGETNTISHSGDERKSEYALSGVRDLISKAILLDTEVHEHHSNNAKNDLIVFDHKLYALGEDDAGIISLYKITVEEYFQSKSQPANKRFHNLKYIEKIAENVGGRTSEKTRSGGSTNDKPAITYSISDLFAFVKKYDSEFKPKTVVKELLNEDGTPKVFYHGTTNQETVSKWNDKTKTFDNEYSKFYTFKKSYDEQVGHFFTDDENNAGGYGSTVYQVYLRCNNPLVIECNGANYSYITHNGQSMDTYEWAEWAKKNRYDGVVFKQISDGTGYGDLSSPTNECVVFYSKQIKSVDENIGTFDGSNPDIRHSTGGTEELLFESEADKARYVADSFDLSGAENYKAAGSMERMSSIANSIAKAHRVNKDGRAKLSKALEKGVQNMRKAAKSDDAKVKQTAAEGFLEAAMIVSPDADTQAQVEIANALAESVWAEMTTNRLTDTIRSIRDEAINAARADVRAERLAALGEKYGTIKPGERPSRVVTLPKKTSEGKKVSQTVRTVMEAEATPDGMIPTLEQMVADGEFSYETVTDKGAIAKAEDKITKRGFDATVREWFKAVGSGKVSKDNTALGWTIYNNAANSGDTELAVEVLCEMVKHQRNAAQALQATRILKKLSPSGQLYAAQKSVQGLQEELEERYGDKAPELKIDPTLADKVINGETEAEREKALADLYSDIGRQMPSSVMDKWNAWRYLSMLGNARTHIRNIVGNAGFAPVVTVKNIAATGIESLVSFVSRGKIGRTKAFLVPTKADRALLAAAWTDYDAVADAALGQSKYNDNQFANKHIEDGRRIFKFKPLEAARRGNSWLLDKEDSWFSKPQYANALAQYCKANGITAQQIQSGKDLEKARAYAIKEAQKATYRDTNAFSELFSKLGRIDERGEHKLAKRIWNRGVEGVLPFRKTPANILARGIEYSPIGLGAGLWNMAFDVKSGKVTAAEAIDKMAAGLTGSGLMALGAFLVTQGVLRGFGGDDEKEKEYMELMGHQQYALEIGNTSVTLDWLAPEALPFFVGANIAEQFMQDGEMTIEGLISALGSISDPMLSMSCLQGLNDLIESVSFSDTSGIVTIVSSAATSYLTQGVPTLFGQLERTSEPERMMTYTTKGNKVLTPDMQYTVGKVSAKLPGDYSQIPYIDAWGRTESSGSVGARAANNMLNPAYTSTISESDMEKELLRLYEQTGEPVLPSRADKSFPIDGEQVYLTAEQYQKYATSKGKRSHRILTTLTKSDVYKGLDNFTKAEIVSKVYTYSNAIAKSGCGAKNSGNKGYALDGWVSKAYDACVKYGIDEATYIAAYVMAGSAGKYVSDGETITNSPGLCIMQTVYSIPGLSQEQYDAMFVNFGVGSKVRGYDKKTVAGKIAEFESDNYEYVEG